MAVTLLDQETQVKNTSPVALYDDTVTPSLANYETNPVSLKDDLNAVRSQLQNFLNRNGAGFPGGNWYDDVVAPVTFEGGSKRGINEVGQQLHDLERKRVLVEVFNPNDLTVGVQATGTLTATVNFADTETVTTGTKTYQFQTALTNVDGNVLIGATLSDSLANLAAAINLGAGAGSLYAAATTANTFVEATSTATTLVLLAIVGGTAGNSIVTTETATNASFGGATLSGGTDVAVSVITRTSQLPSNTTLAVGIVTTLGTVAAAHGGTFGTHSLTQVVGTNISSPKNLVAIVDYLTHDPILSSGRRVYGLFQSESGADGSTATLVTTDRVQISYVRLDANGHLLEAVPFSDLTGTTVHYSATERKALEDFNEQDFLRGATLDVASSTTVTRQVAYDNQGTTPVELTTNATLDLNSAGIAWTIRDLANADLFSITEGSGGGTSTIQIASDVDTFDVNAAVNDFLNGASFDTGTAGTTINVGVTANQIDSGGLLQINSGGVADLSLAAALELNLTDSYRAGSTWSLVDGISLSDASAEWDSFETAFGEVSLLNAIVQAKNSSSHRKVYATVTATLAADVDVSGPANDNNLDVDLGDLSAGSFLSDYDIFHNGSHQYNGANAGANKDVYPGTALTNGQLKFEKKLKIGDIIIVVDRAFGP